MQTDGNYDEAFFEPVPDLRVLREQLRTRMHYDSPNALLEDVRALCRQVQEHLRDERNPVGI